MNRWIAGLVLASMSMAVAGSESCALRAAKLVSAGDVDALKGLFVASDAELAPALQRLAQHVGRLDDLRETSDHAFTRSQRSSVLAPGIGSKYHYAGQWVDARSEKLGPVQIHAAIQHGSACTLLALHIDQPMK